MLNSRSRVLPTPPPSHASSLSARRKLNTSEESSSSSGSVLIDTTSKFRIGAPAPLKPLPLENVDVGPESSARQAFQTIHTSVYQALTRAGLDVESLLFVQRVVRGEEPCDRDFTILIRTVCTDHWVGALDAVLEIIQAKNLSWINVEIYDQRAILEFFPVLDPAPEILQSWSVLEPEILAVLGPETHWTTLTLLKRGYAEEQAALTVTVGLSNTADRTWQGGKWEQLRDLLFPHNLDIAFVRSSLHTASWLPPPIALPSNEFDGPIAMGSSMGTTERNGTMGGYVKVLFGGTIYDMCMTNHHVIQVSSMSQGRCLLLLLNKQSPV